jgi:D-serine deaminase-like pyridoxal phosphate-dependent protein
MDVQYDKAGAGFLPALFLATSVVSRIHKSHVTVDAGLKALAHDGPPPRVMAGVDPRSRFLFQGDEHGAILHPSFLPRLEAARSPADFLDAVDAADADPGLPFPEDAPAEGELVWLQPGHVDPTVNLHDALFLAEEDGSLERLPIDARRVTA